MFNKPKIIGILNITSDSFSDGGFFLDSEKAIQKGQALSAQGADFIELGGESSNPDGQKISPQEEINRLVPVIRSLKTKGIKISVDTYKPGVIEAVLKEGVDLINDITALKDPKGISLLRPSTVPVILMHARNSSPRAEKKERDYQNIINEIFVFFQERIKTLEENGIEKKRLIIDPGMGFFLGGNPEPSLKVLKEFKPLKSLGVKTFISTSRKSFIGTVLNKDINHRGAGTLATEIWAALQGVDFIRTHDVSALHDALRMIQAIQNS
ncbi:MAG TPA: dihydropteroate synthase [Nitrospiria bacterium]|jgi:dihydropteroate synthase